MNKPTTFDGRQYAPVGNVFECHGYQYEVDAMGVIHQLNPDPFTYDAKYVSTYDTPQYQRNERVLQLLRLGFVITAHGGVPESVTDYGYGNGAFLKAAAGIIPDRYGFDLTGIPVDGVEILDLPDRKKVDVMTFWDALEHVPCLDFVRDLPCKTVVISLPFCHYHTHGLGWFNTEYHHLKPNEHLHHFDRGALMKMMFHMGWEEIATSYHEDIIRKRPTGLRLPNILCMAFRRIFDAE